MRENRAGTGESGRGRGRAGNAGGASAEYSGDRGKGGLAAGTGDRAGSIARVEWSSRHVINPTKQIRY